mgnify:CR=1 FL=1
MGSLTHEKIWIKSIQNVAVHISQCSYKFPPNNQAKRQKHWAYQKILPNSLLQYLEILVQMQQPGNYKIASNCKTIFTSIKERKEYSVVSNEL